MTCPRPPHSSAAELGPNPGRPHSLRAVLHGVGQRAASSTVCWALLILCLLPCASLPRDAGDSVTEGTLPDSLISLPCWWTEVPGEPWVNKQSTRRCLPLRVRSLNAGSRLWAAFARSPVTSGISSRSSSVSNTSTSNSSNVLVV